MDMSTLQNHSNNFVSSIESRIQENNELYSRFHLGSFIGGQALTIANALRRTLLSEIPGYLITSVKIEGITHEFATIPGIEENVLTILLNIRNLILTTTNTEDFFNESSQNPLKGYIYFSGPGIIRAKDIKFPTSIVPVNKNQYIASVSSSGVFRSTLTIQKVNPGEPLSENLYLQKNVNNQLSLDRSPKPVKQVNFGIHKVPNSLNQEYISLEIWTDGSLKPHDALIFTLQNLTRMFYGFTKIYKM